MVLEHVAGGAGLLVERAAVLDPERLGHRDLHVVHVAPVPQRFEDPVAEPEDQQVADRLLTQVMVDAVDLRLAEDLADLAVELLRGIAVVAERLLDDDAPPARVVPLVVQPHAPELRHDLGELRWLRGEVEEPIAARAPVLVDRVQARHQLIEAGRLVEVEALVEDPLGERPPVLGLERQDARVLLQRGLDLRSVVVLVEGPPADPKDDELVGQQVGPPQLVERGHDLAMGQVAGSAHQHEDRRVRDPFEPQPLAEDVLHRLGARGPLARPGLAEILHRQGRVLGPRRGLRRDRALRRGLDQRLGLDRALAGGHRGSTRSSRRDRRTRCGARRAPWRRTNRPDASGTGSGARA